MKRTVDIYIFWGCLFLGLIGFFVILRLQIVEANILLPWSAVLAKAATWTLGVLGKDVHLSGFHLSSDKLSFNVGTSCSGLEVVGIYAAFTLAYPASRPRRILGVVFGLILFQILNFLRILSFFWFEDWQTFTTLHIYVWPLITMGLMCSLWFMWIGRMSKKKSETEGEPGMFHFPFPALHPLLLFAGTTFVLLLLFPGFIESSLMHGFAAVVCTSSAGILSFVGITAEADGYLIESGAVALYNLPSCTTTPLMILYVAGVFLLPFSWRGKGGFLLLCFPVFYLLSVGRLVSLVIVEAYAPALWELLYNFYFQFWLLGFMTIAMGWWIIKQVDAGNKRALWLRLALGYGGGLVIWLLAGIWYDAVLFRSYGMILRLMGASNPAALSHDPNLILTYMPSFQMVIFYAFAFAFYGHLKTRALWLSGIMLYFSQLFILFFIYFLANNLHYFPHARFVRALVLSVPFMFIWFMLRKRRSVLQMFKSLKINWRKGNRNTFVGKG